MSTLKHIHNAMIEKYATIFKDIDASIIKDVILTTNNHIEIEEYLNDINNTVYKTNSEIQSELENNYGIDTISELKFEHNGTSHNNTIRKKTNYPRLQKLRQVFIFNRDSKSKIFQKI